MIYSEKNLIKLLEYDHLDSYSAYNSMALILGLEFYNEPDKSIYSICSHAFLLDINNKSCSLIFVDEKLNDNNYKFIEIYFTQFLSNKLVFYYLLRFFTKIIDLDILNTENLKLDTIHGDMQIYKTMCHCIYSGNYCFEKKIPMIPYYNIFTHRFDFLFKNPFISIEIKNFYTDFSILNSKKIVNFENNLSSYFNENKKIKNYIKLENNLSLYFREKNFTITLLKELSAIKSPFFESGNTSVIGKNIFINGEKNKIASFLFKKGISLENAVKYTKKITEN